MNIFDSITAALAKAKAIAAVVLGLFPVIIQSITAAEQALGPGTGAIKLQLVLDLVKAVYARVQGVDVVFEEIVPVLTNLINSLIAGWKATGQAIGGGTPVTPPVPKPSPAQ